MRSSVVSRDRLDRPSRDPLDRGKIFKVRGQSGYDIFAIESRTTVQGAGATPILPTLPAQSRPLVHMRAGSLEDLNGVPLMGSAEIGSGPIGDVLRGASAAMRAGPGLAAGINGSAVATIAAKIQARWAAVCGQIAERERSVTGTASSPDSSPHREGKRRD
jgi:hypothetical protein